MESIVENIIFVIAAIMSIAVVVLLFLERSRGYRRFCLYLLGIALALCIGAYFAQMTSVHSGTLFLVSPLLLDAMAVLFFFAVLEIKNNKNL
jgi:membrane-anchored protein YejM (alkaline phosphatase superfamily)